VVASQFEPVPNPPGSDRRVLQRPEVLHATR
jgi:hypothetical protein